MDWLHVADIGVLGDFLGNLFHEIVDLFPGATKKERCAEIYKEISAFYQANGVADKLDCLLPTCFEQKDSGYKLRASAAKARALVPFAFRITQEMLDPTVPKYAAIRAAAYHLNEVYSALSSSHPTPCETMKEHGIKFAIQYVALHDFCNPANRFAWRIKPKLHLFLHITSDSSIPRLTWTYRDEDFGGSVARMARRRGYLLNNRSTSAAVLSRFKMANPCIRIQ